MTDHKTPTRRNFIKLASSLIVLPLAGCSKVGGDWFQNLLASAEDLSRVAQRIVTGKRPMAPEYSESEVSADFRKNGTTNPSDPAYHALAQNNFDNWRLEVSGLVTKPLSLSLGEVRQLQARTQITRHDCVEGWSDIAKWTGAKLSTLLDLAGPKPEAKYVMFFCADPMDTEGHNYYESISLEDAYLPQTILAYEMNGQTLPVEHGAPIRLRIETQLGYKQAKYVMKIQLVDSYAPFSGGNGGYWEDNGYAWYAGI